MSTTIDERVVQMTFDNKEFEKNVETTKKSVKDLENTLDFKEVDFSALEKSISNIEGKLSGWGEAGRQAIRNIVDSAMNGAKDIAKAFAIDPLSQAWSSYESQTVGIQTLIGSGKLGETEEEAMDKAADVIDKLTWFADETSANITESVNNLSKFVNAGQDVDKAMTAIEGVSILAASAGQNANTAASAMYQMSQALGNGYVRYEDWKSLVQRNMTTTDFKNVVIQAALVEGTLKEIDGKYYATKYTSKEVAESLIDDAEGYVNGVKKSSSAAQKAIADDSDLIEITVDNLAEHLNDTHFLTNDVLIGSFEKYGQAANQVYEYMLENDIDTASQAIAEMQKLGAEIDQQSLHWFQMAQEATTFSQAIESVKLGVKTQWSTIYGDIFGNYLEQKKTWTTMANKMWDIFAGPIANLEEAFSTWRDKDGFDGTTKLATIMENVLDGIISRMDVIGKVWNEVFNPDTVGFLEKITTKLLNWSDAFKNDEQSIENFGTTFKLVLTAIKTPFDSIKRILGAIKESFLKVFSDLLPKSSQEKFDNFTDKLFNIINYLKISDDSVDKIKTGSEKLFTVIRKIIDKGTNFYNDILKPLLSNFKTGIDDISKKIKTKLGSAFDSVKNLISEKLIKKKAKAIGLSSEEAMNAISSLSLSGSEIGTNEDLFLSSQSFSFLDILGNILDKIEEFIVGRLTPITSKLKEGLKALISPFAIFTDNGIEFKWGNIVWLTAIIDAVGTIIAKIRLMNAPASMAKGVRHVLDSVADTFWSIEKITKATSFAIIAAGLLSMAVSLLLFAKVIKDLIQIKAEDLKTGLASLVVLIGIIELMVLITKQLKEAKPNKLLQLSISFGIFAIILKSLSKIPMEDGAKAIGLMTLLSLVVAVYAGVMKLIGKLDTRSPKALTTLTISFAIMSIILKSFSQIDFGDGVKAIGLMTLLSLVVVIYAGVMKLIGKLDKKSSKTLTTLTISFAIMSMILKSFSKIDFGDGVKAIGLMTLLSLVIVIYAGLMKLIGKSVGKSALTSVALLSLIFAAFAGIFIIITKTVTFDEGLKSIALLGLLAIIIGLYAGIIALVGKIKGASSILSLAVSFVVFALIFKSVASIPFDEGLQAIAILGLLVLVITIYVGVMKLVGKMKVSGLLILSACFAILVAVFKSLYKDLDFGQALKTLAVMALLLVAMLGLALIGKLGGSGSIGLVAMSLSLLLIAAALKSIATVDSESLKTAAIVIGILSVVLGALALVLGLLPASAALIFLSLGASAIMFGLGLIATALSIMIFIEAIKSLVMFIDYLKEKFGSLQVAGKQLVTDLVDLLVGFVEGLKEKEPILAQTISDLIKTILQLIIDVLFTTLPDILDAVITILEKTAELLVEYAPEICDAIFKLIASAFEALLKIVQILWNDYVWPFLKKLWNKVSEWASGLWQSIKDWGSGIIDTIGEGISSAWSSFKQWFVGLFDKLIAPIKKVLEYLFPSLKSDKISEVEEDAKYVGHTVSTNVAKGITESTPIATKAASNSANAVLKTTRQTYGVKSPSKKTEQIGEYLMEGLAKGIEENTVKAEDESEKSGNSVIDKLKNAIKSKIGDLGFDLDSLGLELDVTAIMDTTDVDSFMNMLNGEEAFDLGSVSSNMAYNTSGSVNAGSVEKVLSRGEVDQNGNTVIYNTFEITGDDPQTIAEAVMTIINDQMEGAGKASGDALV